MFNFIKKKYYIYNKMVTKSELEKKAEELGIKNVKKMTKEQLMEMLRRRGASVEGKAPPKKKAPVRAPERPRVRPPERRPEMTLKQREEVKRRQMISRQQMQQRNAKMQEMKKQAQARMEANKVRPPQVMQKR